MSTLLSTKKNGYSTLLNINTKVERIFKNPNINFFIIMNLILLITCYSFLNDPMRSAITGVISHPIITIIILAIIILVGYFNYNIAILLLVLLFVVLYSFDGAVNTTTNPTMLKTNFNTSTKTIEGFTNDADNDADNDVDNDEETPQHASSFEERNDINEKKQSIAIANNKKHQNIAKNKQKEIIQNNMETKVKKITNFLTKNLHIGKTNAENNYKKGLLENKQKILEHEMQNRNAKSSTKDNSISSNSKRKKENFQTVDKRKFDPSIEEDTNLLITKEIFQDMINRIEYNYETVPYLKKYIKHRLEEIIDINNLLKDEDD